MTQEKQLQKPEKLEALTALRFFAAGLIVLHHSFDHFEFGASINRFFPTHQAVSFFFVLSDFSLQGVVVDLDTQHQLKLLWESLANTRLKHKVAVHFLDQRKEIVFQGDYFQSKSRNKRCRVKKNSFWIDTVDLTKVSENIAFIGIALFTESDMKLLPVSGGRRDWNNRRLLIPLSNLRRGERQ